MFRKTSRNVAAEKVLSGLTDPGLPALNCKLVFRADNLVLGAETPGSFDFGEKLCVFACPDIKLHVCI